MAATTIHQARTTRQQNMRYLLRGLWYFVCVALTVWFLFPIGWSIITSLKPASEINAVPLTFLPKHLTLENYTNLNNIGSGILRYTSNSVLVSLYTIVGTIVLSTLAGYGFARFDFRGKAALFILVLAPLMIPFQAIMIPLFLVLRALSLNNTLLGLAMVYITAQLPFGIFIMRNVFASVPRDIEEAALIDGCSP
ncbi:MAG: carbohydrate ABC transporter permease, partial [Roseiflexaceae bacterium]